MNNAAETHSAAASVEPADHRAPVTNEPIRVSRVFVFATGLAALLLTGWFAYRPGLHGVFLLDDFSNLGVLGKWGPVNNWGAFWRYVTAGGADPTGRPLALLSFLLDARNWPAAALPFKVTNVLLHLLNGALLCWVLLKVARRYGFATTRATTTALIGSGVWLLHPLFVSTTLYVVQREAMLAATFVFMGIICWCAGRDALDANRMRSGLTWMLAGAWLCTLLATLCKANGILLPLLLAILEATVLRRAGTARVTGTRIHRVAVGILLGIPIVLLCAYLLYVLPGAIHSAPGARGWTVGQRLLTEPRVLVGYLRLLWIPQATSFGIFYDQVHASTGWLQPWTTLPCAIFTSGLIVGAWFARRRLPVAACAILFYFAAQLLESSFLPLQLAFEHRNYLPAAFMFWPVGVWLTAPKVKPAIGRTLAVIIVCLLAAMTWTRAGVWGNPRLQAGLWQHLNPDSPQAQSFSAAIQAADGNIHGALATLQTAATRMPDQPQLALQMVQIQCRTGSVEPETWQRVDYALSHAHDGWNNIANWFVTTIPNAPKHHCAGLTLTRLGQALTAVNTNSAFIRWHSDEAAFRRAAAVFDMAVGRPQRAMTIFDALLAVNHSPGALVEQAQALNAFGYPKLALRHLDRHAALAATTGSGLGMAYIHAWVLHLQGWWPKKIAHLRKNLEAAVTVDAAATDTNGGSTLLFRQAGRPG